MQTQVEAGLEGVGKDQAPSVIIAYEPVWAIGTGKVATSDQAQEVHAFIRASLTKLSRRTPSPRKCASSMAGSMKPANAPELLAQKDIDGGLIGGASLEAAASLIWSRLPQTRSEAYGPEPPGSFSFAKGRWPAGRGMAVAYLKP